MSGRGMPRQRTIASERAGKRSGAKRTREPRRRRALETSQILPDLPRGDLLVVPGPLVALGGDVVVDVVLVAAAAERLAEDVVAFELAGRVEEVRGQGLQAARGEL